MDPGSPHIFYLKEGLCQTSVVPFSSVPRFEEFTNSNLITGETLKDLCSADSVFRGDFSVEFFGFPKNLRCDEVFD